MPLGHNSSGLCSWVATVLLNIFMVKDATCMSFTERPKYTAADIDLPNTNNPFYNLLRRHFCKTACKCMNAIYKRSCLAWRLSQVPIEFCKDQII